MKKEKNKTIKYILFIIYAAVMLYLLFVRTSFGLGGESYFEAVKQHINLKFLRTINNYLATFQNKRTWLYRTATINLLGNIILFIPFGFLLPWIFKKMRNVLCTMLTVALTISIIEIAQALSLRGTCDIDDLFLNMIGALLGYLIWAISEGVKNAGKHS